jgi:crossover junction endodeoxyribonuclease RuvC
LFRSIGGKNKDTLQKPSKIIIGIDPGTLIMGYSIIKVQLNAIQIIQVDVLKLSSKKDNYERLRLIHKKVLELMHHHSPDEFAIEAPFFGKNVQSMLKLGRAQGVAIAAAMNSGIPVTEYSPKKVKQSITGNGNAGKEQIFKMLQNIVALPDKPQYFDATDALAVAICHHFQNKFTVPTAAPKPVAARKRNDSWESFLKTHSHRVVQ